MRLPSFCACSPAARRIEVRPPTYEAFCLNCGGVFCGAPRNVADASAVVQQRSQNMTACLETLDHTSSPTACAAAIAAPERIFPGSPSSSVLGGTSAEQPAPQVQPQARRGAGVRSTGASTHVREKAARLASTRRVTRVKGGWEVVGDSYTVHRVACVGGWWSCSCPAHVTLCSHCLAVQEYERRRPIRITPAPAPAAMTAEDIFERMAL